jgi:hypothetical protein
MQGSIYEQLWTTAEIRPEKQHELLTIAHKPRATQAKHLAGKRRKPDIKLDDTGSG